MVKIREKNLCPYCKQDHLGVAPYCEKYPHSKDCKCPDCRNKVSNKKIK